MHDGSVRAGDRWLSGWVSRVMRSRGYRHHGVIIIIWDEGHNDSSGCCLPHIHGGRIPLFIISRHARLHHRLTRPSTTYSLLRTLEAGFGCRTSASQLRRRRSPESGRGSGARHDPAPASLLNRCAASR